MDTLELKKESNQKTTNLKLVVFPIGQLNVAFTINFVQKVIKYTHIYSSGLTDMGITHLEDQEITVIDLYQRLYKKPFISQEDQEGYLVIAKNTVGEIFAIVSMDTPSLIDVPLSEIRILPESYRQADTLKIASHVTVIPQEDKLLTVFLLDVDSLVPPTK
jgi:chemotaxis signal transduction protein